MDDRFKTLEKYNLWGGNDFPTGYKRQDYLDRILSYTGNRLIKVLVGQRRVGKSYLLRQLASHLANSGVNPRNIFFINCELSAFYFLKTNEDLDSLFNLYLKQINPQGRIYLFIDEIQNVEGWERFANSYSQDYTAEYELFISGSNSKMLSGELATLLAGRYVEFAIYPFSYTEFLGITQKENNKVHYLEYMQSSGMPELYHLSQPEVQRNYKGFDYSKYLKQLKIYGTIKCSKIEVLDKKQANKMFQISNQMVTKVIDNTKNILDEETSSILLGLVLGYKTDIDETTQENFKNASMAHVLAVSGMHVAYVIFGINIVFKRALGKRNTYILSIFILIFYMFITNFAPSVTRAGIMGILLIFSK